MDYQSNILNLKRFKPPTDQQRKVLFLLDRGLTQTYIALRLHISRPRVNQIVKKLECELGLINRVQNNKKRDGVRDYSYFYTLTDKAKSILKGDLALEELTPWRVHNHRMKFHIYQQSGAPCMDKRCGFEKSWKMRGGSERYKFWWHIDINLPSVSIDVHPKTLVFYTDKGQTLSARTKEQAAELGWQAIRKAMEWFQAQQMAFGVSFVLDIAGEQVGKLHMGMAFHEDGPIDGDTTIPGTWVDKSVEKELGPGWKEFECWENHPISSPLEAGVIAAAKIPDALAEFDKKLNPLGASISNVEAMLQGGIPLDLQYKQMVNFMTNAMDRINKVEGYLQDRITELEKENRALKDKLGI
jgi:DNA-binding MarR family transcriptional regulator